LSFTYCIISDTEDYSNDILNFIVGLNSWSPSILSNHEDWRLFAN